MTIYQKNLSSKELTAYIDFLKRMKELGNDFLIKGNMWIPSIKTSSNTPGLHIGRDVMLSNYYESPEYGYRKYTCSHLEETIESLKTLKGRRTDIMFEMTDSEMSLYVNGCQWVVASQYLEDTVDFCPSFSMFEDILDKYSCWTEISYDTLDALIAGHPVTIKGTVEDSGEETSVRLAKKLMKLRGVGCRKVDHTGEYTLINAESDMFDNTIAKLIIHMKYTKIECINMYYLRKY